MKLTDTGGTTFRCIGRTHMRGSERCERLDVDGAPVLPTFGYSKKRFAYDELGVSTETLIPELRPDAAQP